MAARDGCKGNPAVGGCCAPWLGARRTGNPYGGLQITLAVNTMRRPILHEPLIAAMHRAGSDLPYSTRGQRFPINISSSLPS
jgi:hypothetical protein